MIQPLPVDSSLACSADPRGLGGLVALIQGVERPLPLQHVRVRATLVGTLCRTVIEQRYANPHPHPIEVVHLFPLPEDGAVVEAELVCGEITVRAECRERAAAEKVYADARQAGHRALLLTQERPDIHTLRVTNLPPGEAIAVRIVVIENLMVEDGRAQWRFPTTIAPRYLPGTATGHRGPGVHPDTDHAPDASLLSPPLRLAGGTPLDLEVLITGRPTSIAVAQHAVRLDLHDGVRVAPTGLATLDRDFVLAVGWENEGQVGVSAWTDGVTTLVHVVPPLTAASALPRDAVFVVDISGSMGGVKIDAARRALASALHGLVPGDRFRLLAFDDQVEEFRPEFTPYDDRSVALADRWIAALHARGGTEMLAPLIAAFAGERVEGRIRTVLFITDGQAYNDRELMAAAAGRRIGAHLHTLGIDTAVNGSLLKGLARLGGGTCTLCTPSDDIEATIARIEARFGAPLVHDVTVEGQSARPEAVVLYAGMPSRFVVRGAPDRVRVHGKTATGDWTAEAIPTHIEVDLGVAWAREHVAWLEDRLITRPFEEEAIRPEVVRIAVEAGIASRYTAFVAVERTRVVGGGAPIEVVQPAEVPEGWSAVQDAPEGGRRRSMSVPSGWREAVRPPPMPSPSRRAVPVDARAAPDADEIDAMVAESATPAWPQAPRVLGDMARKVKETFGAPPAPPPGAADAVLAATQSADGSFGGDLRRTVAALVALILLGNTRRRGLRKRTVTKAAAWLEQHRGHPDVDRALRLLVDAEASLPLDRGWIALHDAGPEGALLARVGA